MPTYNFINNKTGKEFTDFMSLSELDTFLKENPDVTQGVGSPAIIAGTPGKPDNGFRDLLKHIKKGNNKGITRSTINTF
jgi:hypothetical protein